MIPRGQNILDMQARMAASYVPRHGQVTVTAADTPPVTDPETGNALPGGLFYPGDRTLHTVTVQGTFSATVAVQGSQDNQTFQTLIPDATPAGSQTSGSISAPGVFVYRGNYRSLRVTCTSYTSGTATVLIESTRG
ncbi:MAG: hypothetical protein K6V97_03890 [Actinomycetia bacterium]|nr:hypothetical protein [Actinomycetes bacterium]